MGICLKYVLCLTQQAHLNFPDLNNKKIYLILLKMLKTENVLRINNYIYSIIYKNLVYKNMLKLSVSQDKKIYCGLLSLSVVRMVFINVIDGHFVQSLNIPELKS